MKRVEYPAKERFGGQEGSVLAAKGRGITPGGKGEGTILLLHGGGLNWWNFRAVAELLQKNYHVVLPILDGHAGSDAPFRSIEENAKRIIEYIDREWGGSVMLLGGLSLGAQIAVEVLRRRGDICRYALLESASVIPDPLTHTLIGPSVRCSYGLIRKRWFSRWQFSYLRIPEDLFADYYRDSCGISCEDMVSFLAASTAYACPERIETRAKVRMVVGEREAGSMRCSARLLQEVIPGSSLSVLPGFYHGEYSLREPERYAQDLVEFLSL